MIRALTLALLLLGAAPVAAATVLSVGDGDTLRVSDGGKRTTIRLACIDAPETAQSPHGEASRQRLQQLAPVGSVVTIRPQTKDKYGRTVAEVFRDGQSLNLAMVSTGQAFAYRKYLGQCNAQKYLAVESQAQYQRAGVWATPGGITRPWDWRAERRESPPAPPPRPASGPAHVNLGVMSGGGSAPGSGGGGGGGGGRYYCKNLSHQQAQRLLSQGHTYLDRDGDGEACEGSR